MAASLSTGKPLNYGEKTRDTIPITAISTTNKDARQLLKLPLSIWVKTMKACIFFKLAFLEYDKFWFIKHATNKKKMFY
jgi:hypothetical protein